jgi:hypothetical protein
MRSAMRSLRFRPSGKSRSKTQVIRNAIARFSQVGGVSDAERDAAWQRIQTAARKYGVEIHDTSWRRAGVTPSARRANRG